MSGGPLQKLRRGARRDPLRTRLGRKLLGWFLLFSLVPLLGSNMLGYLESRGIIEGLIEGQLTAIASVQALHIRDQLDRLTIGLEMVAAANESFVAHAAGREGQVPSRVGAYPTPLQAIEDQLRQKLDEMWEFEALYLQGRDGSVFATTSPSGEEPASTPTVAASEVQFEVLDADARSGRPRFRLSVPLRDNDREVVGRLGALIEQRGFGGLLEIPAHMAGSIESFIVDEQGRPIFISHVHSQESYGSPLGTPLMAQPPGTFLRYTDRQGMDVFGIAVPIEALGWRYIAEFPVAAALGPLRFLRRVSIFFGGAFAVLLTITAWFVAGGIVAPVRRLVTAARRVGQGDLDVQVEADQKDEIGELGVAFNEMTSDLADVQARVRELHAREIERAQQLATVGELASGVAHEIKNPVVGISGGLDLVSRRIGDDEVLTPIIDEMSRQLSRIEMAVRDLLAFARPSTPNLAPADGNEIAERATRLIEPAAEQAHVRVSFEADPSLPELRVDAELIRQALVNLLLNAVQATSPGGRVTISTTHVDGEVLYRVTDTGRGIPEEEQEEIFKPFFTTRHAGSGLGLSITRKIVERHGGRVDLKSHPGQGSTFTLRIPLIHPAEPDAAVPTGMNAGGGPP